MSMMRNAVLTEVSAISEEAENRAAEAADEAERAAILVLGEAACAAILADAGLVPDVVETENEGPDSSPAPVPSLRRHNLASVPEGQLASLWTVDAQSTRRQPIFGLSDQEIALFKWEKQAYLQYIARDRAGRLGTPWVEKDKRLVRKLRAHQLLPEMPAGARLPRKNPINFASDADGGGEAAGSGRLPRAASGLLPAISGGPKKGVLTNSRSGSSLPSPTSWFKEAQREEAEHARPALPPLPPGARRNIELGGWMAQFDVNGDGIISEAEFEMAMNARGRGTSRKTGTAGTKTSQGGPRGKPRQLTRMAVRAGAGCTIVKKVPEGLFPRAKPVYNSILIRLV